MITIDKAHREADPRIIGYMEDVLSGRIVACEKIHLACQRFHDDLTREGKKDFPWRFDGELASRPIRFMEKFMRPSGDYDRMTLMPWQCHFEGNLFGWRHRDTGERKYRKVLLLVGSGNGKSPLIAGTALYVQSQEGVRDCQVDVFANSKDQANIVLDDCRAMVQSSTALSNHFTCKTSGINYDKGGVIRARSSEARNLDGIRPTMALFDEGHQMQTYRVINHSYRSLNKAKENQLFVMISTMGTVLDGVLVNEYTIGDKILKGQVPPDVADRELVLIYEIDEKDRPQDGRCWIKANPSLGVLLRYEDLLLTWRNSQHIPQLRSDFITKTCNVFTKADQASFLDYKLVTQNDGMAAMEELQGREAYGGFDMSASEDHCSCAIEVQMEDGRLAVIPHTWVPRAKAERDQNTLDYYEMAQEGLLTIVEGDYVDQSLLIEWFEKMARVVNLKAIGYDPANATLLVRALSSYRGEKRPVFTCEPVRQGSLTLNAPMKDLKERFLNRQIVYNQNRLFRWYLDNVKIAREDRGKEKDNWMPVKVDKLRKIDGFMAFLDAHTVWMRNCLPEGVEAAEPEVEFYQLSLSDL